MQPQFKAVGIVTSDMERSVAFYRLLGLDVADAAGAEHLDIEGPGGLRLMLDTEDVIRSFRPDWQRADGNQVALAFDCGRPADVDAVYARLTSAGHGEKEPWDAFWGYRYAQVLAPDGVTVDLYAPL